MLLEKYFQIKIGLFFEKYFQVKIFLLFFWSGFVCLKYSWFYICLLFKNMEIFVFFFKNIFTFISICLFKKRYVPVNICLFFKTRCRAGSLVGVGSGATGAVGDNARTVDRESTVSL